MDYTVMALFLLAAALTLSLFGASDCTSGCSHDNAIEHCLETQLELTKTSSMHEPINLRCMGRN